MVLHEMLTGARTFSGETVSDTLAAVLRADLNWSTMPPDYELSRGSLNRLTFGPDNTSPVWTPDGKRVAYRAVLPSPLGGISWVPVDHSGPLPPINP